MARGLLSLVLGACLVACAGAPGDEDREAAPAFAPAGEGDEQHGGGCEPGATEICHLTLSRHDGVLSCFVGVRACLGGAWGPCTDGVVELYDDGGPDLEPDEADHDKWKSLSGAKSCDDNPCDPACKDFAETPGPGAWKMDGESSLYGWKVGDKAALSEKGYDALFEQPCETGSDCQASHACRDPHPGTCAHDLCATGQGLVKGCSRCTEAVCAQKPECCEKKYAGTCEHEPCIEGTGLKPGCDDNVAKTCAWDKTCCPYDETTTICNWEKKAYACEKTYDCFAWKPCQKTYQCGWEEYPCTQCGWQWVTKEVCDKNFTCWLEWHPCIKTKLVGGWKPVCGFVGGYWEEKNKCGWQDVYNCWPVTQQKCGFQWVEICEWVLETKCELEPVWMCHTEYVDECGWQTYTTCGYQDSVQCGYTTSTVCGWSYEYQPGSCYYVCSWGWWGLECSYECSEGTYVATYDCWQESSYDCWTVYSYTCWDTSYFSCWTNSYVICGWEYVEFCWTEWVKSCWNQPVPFCWEETVQVCGWVPVYKCWPEWVWIPAVWKCWWEYQVWFEDYPSTCDKTVCGYKCWNEQVLEPYCWLGTCQKEKYCTYWDTCLEWGPYCTKTETCYEDEWVCNDVTTHQPGKWAPKCVNHYKKLAPGACPASWPGNWDAGCVAAVRDVCGAFCAPPGEAKGSGVCDPWTAGEKDAACALPSLTVGLTCTGKIPICNHGSVAAPSGITILHAPAGSGAFGKSDPGSVPGAATCTTKEPIDPGTCIEVTDCAGLTEGREIMVNPPGRAHVKECYDGDNWGLYLGGACVGPKCAATVLAGKTLSCTIALPANEADYDAELATVLLKAAAGAPATLPRVSGPAACGKGWHFDDEASPTAVVLCPQSCAAVEADPASVLEISFGCPGSYVETAHTEIYEAECPPGTTARWTHLTWETECPSGSSVTWEVRTATLESALGAETFHEVGVAAAKPVDTTVCALSGPEPCPIDLVEALGKEAYDRRWLELRAVMKPNEKKNQAPVIEGWHVTYTCLALE
jgi:hypothetical protein